MARNGSGTMTAVATVSSGAALTAEPVQNQLNDINSELTNSVAKDGQTIMTGPLKAANGSASAPTMTFGSDTNTGFYRSDADTIGVAAGGVNVGTVDAEGFKDTSGRVFEGPRTGDVKMYFGTGTQSGWLRMNGQTIGSASSGGTALAAADCEDLFILLWPVPSLSVSGSRGATAAADWAANKTIALPSFRGRAPFGLDSMGATAAAVLGTVITTPDLLGSVGGTETHQLTSAQMPTHTHGLGTLATASDGAHTHSVTGGTVGGTGGSTLTAGTGGNSVPLGTGTIAISSGGAHTHALSGALANTGTDAAHSNMPPGMVLTFLIKL